MYNVRCTKCGKEYESNAKRNGVCPDCRKTRSQINTAYRDKNYDTMRFYVPKGQKALFQKFAAEFGMSMNEFCNNAIRAYAEQLAESKEKDNA